MRMVSLVLWIIFVIFATKAESAAPCINGNAKGFACKNVDFQALISFQKLGGGVPGSNVWGFVDPDDGREYALFGYGPGTAVIEVTNPKKTGFFDTYPESEQPIFQGAWRGYPFLHSGNILISDINLGLFILKENR